MFLLRYIGNVLIEIGVIGCLWFFVFFSEYVSCRKSGDFIFCLILVFFLNLILFVWFLELDIFCILFCWIVLLFKKMLVLLEVFEFMLLFLFIVLFLVVWFVLKLENDLRVDWKVEKKEGNMLFVLL